MIETRISAKNLVEGQIPLYFQEEYPLFGPFLKQYYESQEHFSAPLSIVQNIDQLLKVGTYTSEIIGESNTRVSQDVDYGDSTIYVNSTNGWPDRYGLLKINDEIITYTSLGSTSFNGCIRGFSGITTYNIAGKQVSYESSEIDIHSSGATVENLSTLFLKEFFKKLKAQYLPGFEDFDLYSNLNSQNFLIQSKDFYSSKGTPTSNKILFKSLFNEDSETIKPQEYLFKPSANDYRPVKTIIAKPISGDPLKLSGGTLFQEIKTESETITSYGSISDVELIYYENEPYYSLDVDFGYDRDIKVFGTLFGNIKLHSKTKIVSRLQNSLVVDSTIGFPEKGSLIVNGNIITYNSKTNNQFLNCIGISVESIGDDVIASNYETYGFDENGQKINVRVTGVIENLNLDHKNNFYYSVGNPVNVKSIGFIKEKNDALFNSWIFNTSTSFNIENIKYTNPYFEISTYDDHQLNKNDQIEFINKNDNSTLFGKVEKILTDKKIRVSANIDQSSLGEFSNNYSIRRVVNTFNNSEKIYTTNVQDVYDLNGSLVVTSPSIPSYEIQSDNRSKTVSVTGLTAVTEITIQNHNFYSGDKVVFFSGSDAFSKENKKYFVVKKIDNNTIKLSLSASNITNNTFYTFYNSDSDSQSFTLIPSENYGKILDSQKLVRKIEVSRSTLETSIETPPGKRIGILANGVEILNYKSNEVVHYGPINSIDVLNGGNDYDVINPPVLEITDSFGIGATGNCSVSGSLKRIEILDPGFGYVDVPKIIISGGNGSGASAVAKLREVDHELYFNAAGISTGGGLYLNFIDNIIGFNTDHKFNNGEEILYNSFNGQKIGIGSTSGDTTTKTYLQDNSSYFVSVVDQKRIKIHNNEKDSLNSLNPINLTEGGSGTQRFRSTKKKNVISHINVISEGSGYENKKKIATTSGIITSSSYINIPNHGYNSGEIITYSCDGTTISGLSTSEKYYAIKIDDNNFRLASAGIGTYPSTTNYETNQYVVFTSKGSGNHIFNYPQITISVVGNIGVGFTLSQNYNAIVNPVFRGEITSIQLTSNGSGYGSTDIIGFDRQPNIELKSGSGAIVKPIIKGSSVSSILVISGGSGYNSSPNLEIVGEGSYLKAAPIIENGVIKSFKIENGGVGFTTDRSEIEVKSSGSDAKFKSNIKKWTVNIAEKYKNTFSKNDDGFITSGISSNLQYTCLFAPRNLRLNLPSKNTDGSNNYNEYDLVYDANERISTNHSPIIGWAYDGNPIYGPYGYEKEVGGTIKPQRSGYEQVLESDRPQGFEVGFFVEDYKFTNNGDLDEHNGRFCKTPEFPNGTYAYFASIETSENGYDSSYLNYRRPKFPYLIGNKFKSKLLNYNLLPSSNQNDVDFSQENYIRNTYPYKLNFSNSEYEGITQPNKTINRSSKVSSIQRGSIDGFLIDFAGLNYKVGDSIVFNSINPDENDASAQVSEIFESRISSINSQKISLNNVSLEILTTSGLIQGISTVPHGLKNFDVVNITGISSEQFSKLDGFNEINVKDNNFVLSVGLGTIGSTGISTFLQFYKFTDPSTLQPNDVLSITKTGVGTEKLLVIGVDPIFGRVNVKRGHDGTIGYAYSVGTIVVENPRRFTYNSGFSTDSFTNIQKLLYFNPKESVAVGVSSVSTVGLGTTISISYGSTFINEYIPLQSIYLPNHNLLTGQRLIYSNGGGISISVSTGTGSTTLENGSSVYVAKFTKDLIGISTVKVGLGSTGGFVGIGQTANLLYFSSIGSGTIHSFKTQEVELSAQVQKITTTVNCDQNHNLEENDVIRLEISPGISTTVIVKYNSYNRRLVIDPVGVSSIGINTVTSTITLESHGLKTGDKVIYSSSNPSFGLTPEKIYYIVKVDDDKFKLANSYYQTQIDKPTYVSIASTGVFHEFSKVNPQIKVTKGNVINFDLSDSSLADIDGGSLVKAFDFDFYTDSTFTTKFLTSLKTQDFEVKKTGIIGVTNNASVSITLNENIPSKLYYKLTPLIGKSYLSKEKEEVIVDTDVYEANSIAISPSKYNSSHIISGIGSTTFSFGLKEEPEKYSYTKAESQLKYLTNSSSATGSISKIKILFGGRYSVVPGITSVRSNTGNGAVIIPNSETIGKILKSPIEIGGFEYHTDPTLKPISEFPIRLFVEELFSIKNIGLTYGGKNYSSPPNFVVLDGATNELKSEVVLESEIENNKISKVSILKNTNSLYGVTPKIVSTNNTNGIGVTNIQFNATTKQVTVNLASGFSTASSFPFSVGSKIYVEGIGISTIGDGFNSENYGYKLFTLTGVTSAIGGNNPTLNYTLSETNFAGQFSRDNSIQNSSNSFGRIIPESYLPKFEPTLFPGEITYGVGENVKYNNKNIAKVVEWIPSSKILKINDVLEDIPNGAILKGEASNTNCIVISKIESESSFNVSSTTDKLKDYSKETGKIGTFLQVLQDGDYYQNFSYSIKSKVPIEKWNDKVDSLTHTSGFKKFSDLQVESQSSLGISEHEEIVDVFVDLINEKDFDCYEDFDFVKENVKSFGGKLTSDQIIFSNAKLLDYTEFISNRVLEIDDISSEFDDTPSIFNYCVVGTFDITKYNSAQFCILIKDTRYYGEKELIIVNVTYDGSNGYLNAYGRNETVADLGYFSFRRSGNNGEILFYPSKYEYNSYNISNIVTEIANNSITGIGTSSLGDVVSFASTSIQVSSSSSPVENTIVSISTTRFSSGKILLSAFDSTNTQVQFGEISVTNNGSEVFYQIFGEIDSGDRTSSFGSGVVGQIGVSTSTGNILITFTPNPNIDVDVKALSILMGSSSFTGISTYNLYKSKISSNYVSIASSTSPVETKISGFSTSSLNPPDGAHYYVQVTDTTNGEIQFSEVILTNQYDYTPQIAQYCVIGSSGELGSIGAASTSGETQLTFTPNANINVEVRTFQKTVQISPITDPIEIDLESARIRSDIIPLSFEGTQISTKKDFNLKHKDSPIFRKIVDGSSTNVIDIEKNTISIPNHFFVSGEKIDYSTNETRIGIATTSVIGVGTTNLLPTTLYAVKIDDNLVKFAETAEKALSPDPDVFNIQTVGIGQSHVFSSNYKSNSKAIICIDNVIQNPVVSSARTTSLLSDIEAINSFSLLTFENVNGFYAKDLIKIDDEFLIITDVGLGGTNKVYCRREQLGTISTSHSLGSVITRYEGNYNILNDSIYFVESPHGDESDSELRSSFQGRVFLRSSPVGSSNTAYYENQIFDDISEQFNGTDNTFTLKSNGQNVTGIVSTNSISAGILLINNIFQKPKYPATGIAQTYTYEVIENSGISSVTFSGNPVGLTTNGIIGPMKYDINSAGIPRGGIIVSVGSTQGYGFQPLVAAGGTANISIAGTIQSVSIGNSGSGYRPGIQTSINVSVATSTGRIAIGTASAVNGHIVSIAVTNVGSGYTTTNPPIIVIDSPLNYENIPMVYSPSNSGVGTEATVDIQVGYGNSIIEFNLSNSGYGYSIGDRITFNIGGNTGIPTDPSISFRPFELIVSEVFNDKFNSWYPGQFVVLDDFNGEFDGSKKLFTLKENGVISNFVTGEGSPLELEQNLLVFINDVLQIPNESYIFNGGTKIEFLEAPKQGDSVKVLFFKGSDADVNSVEIVPTIKEGDRLTITDKFRKGWYSEKTRIVSEINSVDSVFTSSYFGPGITSDASIVRTVEWCKQREDFYLDEILISKSRKDLNSNIFPNTTIISPVGVASTSIFVQNVRPLFNYYPEILSQSKQTVKIISQEQKLGAIATALVSVAGSISQINILNGGLGFSTAPTVSISSPSIGTTAIATCSIGFGTVSSVIVSNGGFGYTSTNPPQILIEQEPVKFDVLTNVNYEGDHGIITGIGTTSISGVSTGIYFDFYFPQNSIFRNSSLVGSSSSVSGIQTGYYFVVYESTVGSGLTSLNDNGNVLGIGTTFIDNVYKSFDVKIVQSNAVGYGSTTDILRVTTSVTSHNNLSGIGSQFIGMFSWGRIYNFNRVSSDNEYGVDLLNGLSGITTSALIVRTTPIRSLYTS